MTSEDIVLATETPLLQVRLSPYRSLSPRGFIAVMVLIGTISFVAGLAFWLRGAWPVAGFCGLDVALMWWAFRSNFRSAQAHEEIVLGFHDLRLTRVDARGGRVEWHCNPAWAALDVVRHPDEGVTMLALRSRGQRHVIGAFLGAGERTALTDAVADALRRAKAGPSYGSPTA